MQSFLPRLYKSGCRSLRAFLFHIFISPTYSSSTSLLTISLIQAQQPFRSLCPKIIEAVHESFFHDTISDETNESLADAVVEMPKSRNKEYYILTELSGSNTTAKPTNVIIEPTETLDRSDPLQALVIFVLSKHRFSDSYKLGVINEHPKALQTITSNQCFSTSAFLKPALYIAIAKLCLSIIVQVAVRLTAITLQLAIKILQTKDGIAQYLDVCKNEQQELSKTIRFNLKQVVLYY